MRDLVSNGTSIVSFEHVLKFLLIQQLYEIEIKN